jgi:hypothetical protein
MSKKSTNQTQPTTHKVRFYQKAVFPWAIIVIATALFSGVVTGWTLRSNQESDIKAEVSSQVADALKAEAR